MLVIRDTHQGDKCYLFLLFGHQFSPAPQLHLMTMSFIFQQGNSPKLDLQVNTMGV